MWSTESDGSTTEPSDDVPSTELWHCSFERQDNALCGMTQERSRDQFDWTVHSGPTPSEKTGPTWAHGGQYYAFIETSNPRPVNDTAWYERYILNFVTPSPRYESGIFIDRVALEIIRLVASVCVRVCVYPFVCLCVLSCLNRLTLIFGMKVDLDLG